MRNRTSFAKVSTILGTAGQLAILNNWLSELLGLHEAAIATLFNAKKGDSGSMSIMSSIMGIKWMKDSPGVPVNMMTQVEGSRESCVLAMTCTACAKFYLYILLDVRY